MPDRELDPDWEEKNLDSWKIFLGCVVLAAIFLVFLVFRQFFS
jgi:hypothetical protein